LRLASIASHEASVHADNRELWRVIDDSRGMSPRRREQRRMDTFDTSHGFYARQRNVMDPLQHRRERMVEFQIARRGVHDARLLAAMREVPRESFVGKEMEKFAYDDTALPIAEGQTISQPYIVAMMIDAAELTPGERVLEVGAGSGYAAAVVSRMTAEVYAIERHATLAQSAAKRFAALGYDNIRLRVGDGTRGWPEAAPFDAILVAASAPEIPSALKEQLVIGGRLVIPIGGHRWGQALRKVTRVCQTDYELKDLGAVAFVPLIGEQGWDEGERRAASMDEPEDNGPPFRNGEAT
jgi:protein-L-isoaspartate(D-aspartate) O-methyltransferase